MKKIFKLISIILICVCVSSCKNKFKDGVYDGEYEEETQYVTYTANVEVIRSLVNSLQAQIEQIRAECNNTLASYNSRLLAIEEHLGLV